MKNIINNYKYLRKCIVIAALLFCSKAFTQDSDAKKDWKYLQPMKHYNYKEFIEIHQNSEVLESNPIKIGIVDFKFYIPQNEIDYIVPKHQSDSKRIVVTVSYTINEKLIVLDTFCCDTIIGNFENLILISGDNFLMPCLDKNGKEVFVFLDLQKMILKTSYLSDCHFTTGALDIYSEPYEKYNVGLYFWDANTNKLWCYSFGKDEYIDLKLKLKKPVFFTNEAKDSLYIAEESTVQNKSGKFWKCKKNKLVTINPTNY